MPGQKRIEDYGIRVGALGSLESVIALTNTLNVGLVHDAVVEYMLREGENAELDIEAVNPPVFECNDSYLNNILNRAAIKEASADFGEGDIGTGKVIGVMGRSRETLKNYL